MFACSSPTRLPRRSRTLVLFYMCLKPELFHQLDWKYQCVSPHFRRIVSWKDTRSGLFVSNISIYFFRSGVFLVRPLASYPLMWGGCLLISFSLFMLSMTKPNHYYQILLSQGLGLGIGTGMIYVPAIAVLSHYFQRRRSLVMTMITSGSSIGSIVHPIMLNRMLQKFGFATATRANAGLIAVLLIIACLLMRTRLPPSGTTPSLKKALIKFSKDKAYMCCTLG